MTKSNQVQQNDLAGLKSLGHKLHGAAASAGLLGLSGMARKLELDQPQDLLEQKELAKQIKAEIVLVFKLLGTEANLF